jgi:hypothetical protein
VNKEVRDFLKAVETVGWSDRGTRSTHIRLGHDEYGATSLACTPGDHRWENNAWSQLASMMGISTGELKQRALGLRGTTQPVEVRKKRRGRVQRRQALPVQMVSDPPVSVRVHRGDGVTDVRKEAWVLGDRRNLAVRAGDWTAVRELDAEIATLMGEEIVKPKVPPKPRKAKPKAKAASNGRATTTTWAAFCTASNAKGATNGK